MPLTYWIVLFSSLNNPSGGVLQLHRFAEALHKLGQKVFIVQDNPRFHPDWFFSSVETFSAQDWDYGKNLNSASDVIVLPETFVSEYPRFKVGIPKIIFNQNTSYTFGLLDSKSIFKPETILSYYNHPDVVKVCCVSEYDMNVMEHVFGISSLRLLLIPNSLHVTLPTKQLSLTTNIVSYMPRKNPRDSLILRSLLERHSVFSGWEFLPIKNLPHSDAVQLLSKSSLFLSFGFPEGFGLPILESLACQTPVIGYSGLGGRELFSIADLFDVGWEVEYGDYLGFINAFKSFSDSFYNCRESFRRRLQSASVAIQSLYSVDNMYSSVRAMCSDLSSSLKAT